MSVYKSHRISMDNNGTECGGAERRNGGMNNGANGAKWDP